MNENNEVNKELQEPEKRVNKKRRSFTKAGVVAPVVLTLANRPAWGAVSLCTVSGFQSVAAAGGRDNYSGEVSEEQCFAKSHGFYKEHNGFDYDADPAEEDDDDVGVASVKRGNISNKHPWPANYIPGKYNQEKSGYDTRDGFIATESASKIISINNAFGVNTHGTETILDALKTGDEWMRQIANAILCAAEYGSSFGLGDVARVQSVFQALDGDPSATYNFGPGLEWNQNDVLQLLSYIYDNHIE